MTCCFYIWTGNRWASNIHVSCSCYYKFCRLADLVWSRGKESQFQALAISLHTIQVWPPVTPINLTSILLAYLKTPISMTCSQEYPVNNCLASLLLGHIPHHISAARQQVFSKEVSSCCCWGWGIEQQALSCAAASAPFHNGSVKQRICVCMHHQEGVYI